MFVYTGDDQCCKTVLTQEFLLHNRVTNLLFNFYQTDISERYVIKIAQRGKGNIKIIN